MEATMNELRRVYEPMREPVSLGDLVMYSGVRLTADYETEGHHLPEGKVGTLVEVFSEKDCGVEYGDLQDVLVIPRAILIAA